MNLDVVREGHGVAAVKPGPLKIGEDVDSLIPFRERTKRSRAQAIATP